VNILIGIFSFFGQITLNLGIKYVAPAKGTILNYLQIVYAYLISIFIIGEHINLCGILGMLLILSNSIILVFK